MKSRLTVAALLLVIPGATATLRAQTTVPYANGSTDSNSYSSTGNPLTLLVASGSATQSGVISGSGDITKSGAGLLTLSGANTYTGGTILAGGILALEHADALGGTDSLSFTGGTLRYGSVGTTDYSALIKNSTSAVSIDTNGEHAAFDAAWSATNTGGLTKSGGGSLTFSGDLSAFTGPVIVGGGTLAFNGSGPLTFTSLSGTGNLYLGAFALTVGASDTSGAFSGNITGLASLKKVGAGTLTLSGTNTYNAGITLAGGTLSAGSSGALGSTGTISFEGGTLQFSSANATDYSPRFSTAAGQQYRFDTNGQRVSLTQALTSSGATLTKSGAGTLVLSGANSYSGGTWITGGTIELAGNNALGSGAVTITDAGLRAAGAPRTLTNALFLSGVFTVGRSTTFSGLTTLNAATTILASNADGLANADTTFSGVITGNYGLTLAEGAGTAGIGTGYLVLSGANTYTGGTTIRTRVSINADSALGNASGSLTMDGGTLHQTTGIVSARDIILSAGGGTFDSDNASSLSGTISGAGALTKSGAGTLTLSGTNTYAGGTRVEAGLLNLTRNEEIGSGGLVLAGGDLNFASSTFITSSLTLTSDATVHLNGGWSHLNGAIIAGAARNLTFTGSGIIDLSAADVSQLAGRVTVEDQLFVGAGFSPAELVLGDGATLLAMADVTVSSTLTGTGAELSLRSNNHALALTGVISGTFTNGLHIDGGDITLGGVNTFTGTIDVSGTTLRITNSSSLGAGNATVELFGSTLQSLGDATLTRNFTSAGNGIDTNGYALELTGTIASGALLKNGAGTLTLSGSNQLDYVQLNAGTLAISAVANINSERSPSILFNGGTLRATNSFTLPNANLIVDGVIEVDAGQTLASSLLHGDGGVIKTGAGILDLGLLPNSYAGGTTVRAGILQTSAPASLGAAGADFTLDGGTFRALFDDAGNPATFALDHRLLVAAGGGTIDLAVANTTVGFTSVTGTGDFALTGPGTFLLQTSPDFSGKLTVGGDSTLNFNAITSFGTAVIALEAGGRVTGSATTLANAFQLTGAARFDASGVFSGAFTGTGGLTTTNTLTLSGNNTFAGGLTASAGTLTLASSTAAGTGTLTLNGATVELSGSATNLANAVTLGAATQVRVTAAETAAELSGVLTDGASSYGLTKSGAGSLTLSGANTYNGGTTVSGGRLILTHDNAVGTGGIRLEAGTTLGFIGTRSFANDLVLAGNSTAQTTLASDSATLDGNISGGFGLTKTGAGTLTLNGNNSFSGNLVLVEGTLALGSTDASGDGKLVLQGGTLVTTGWVTNQVLLSGTVVIAALTEPEFFNMQLTADATLDVAGDLRLSGDLSVQGSTPFILTKTGAGSLTFAASSYDQVGLTHSAGTLYLDRDISGLAGGLTLTGGSLASHLPVIQVHDPVQLRADTALLGQLDLYFRGATTLEANVALTVVEATSTLHITDSIGDNGDGYALTKTGPGTLNLGDQAHTFSGGFTLESGKVIVGQTSAGAFGTGPLTLNGGTVQANSADVPITNTLTLGGDVNFTSTGTGTLVFSGATTLAQNITLTTETTLTFDGAIGDDGQAYALTKDGHGELRLNGANTFSGGLTLNQGLTVLGSASAAGSGTITFAAGSGLEATGTLANAITFSGSTAFYGGALELSGPVTLTGNTSLDLTLDPALTVSGVIADGTGDFTLTNTGGRALILSGANTWSGGMLIFSGLVRAENDAAFGTGTLTFGGGTITTELADRTFANALILAGNVALQSEAGRSFTFTGPVSIDAPTVLSGFSAIPTTEITFAGALSGSSSLTINTGSSVKLTADNSAFSGGLILGSFANVTLGHDHAAGSGLLTLNSGTLTAAGARTLGNALSLGGFITMNGDGFVFEGNVNVSSLTGVFVNTSLTFNGNLSGTETLQLLGPNSVALNGDNSGLTGGMDLMLVQATLGSDTALGTGPVTLMGATLIAGGSDRTISNTINLSMGFGTSGTHALTLSGPVVLQPPAFFPGGPVPPAGVTIAANSPLTISGVISETESSSVTLVGAATVTFAGANTYTGATHIEAGTLALAATGSIANSATINVASGATFNVSAVDHFTLASGQTLTGTGSIVGPLTVGSGAHLAPGNSPGTLTFTGGLTLNDGAILDFQLGNPLNAATSDRIALTNGLLSVNGTITVNLTDSGGFTAGTYTLIDATGNLTPDALSSIGATTFELGTVIAGYTYTFSQTGDTLDLIVTSAIPEPASATATLAFVALASAAWRRPRQNRVAHL